MADTELNISPDEKVAGVPLARLLRNLEETSYDEGSMDLACRLTDCKAVVEELLQHRALASRPAEVDDEGLPPLPKPTCLVPGVYAFTWQQYRQGQRDAVAAMASRIAYMEAWLKQIATVNAMDYEYQKWARQALSAPSHTTNKEK